MSWCTSGVELQVTIWSWGTFFASSDTLCLFLSKTCKDIYWLVFPLNAKASFSVANKEENSV